MCLFHCFLTPLLLLYLIFEPLVTVNEVVTVAYNCPHTVHPHILSYIESNNAYMNCEYVKNIIIEVLQNSFECLKSKSRKHKANPRNILVIKITQCELTKSITCFCVLNLCFSAGTDFDVCFSGYTSGPNNDLWKARVFFL